MERLPLFVQWDCLVPSRWDPGGMAKQLPWGHFFPRILGVRKLPVREVLPNWIVDFDLALLDELQHSPRGDRLVIDSTRNELFSVTGRLSAGAALS